MDRGSAVPKWRNYVQRRFWPVLLLIIASTAAVELVSLRNESQTWDEGFEIASGYSYLRTGSYRISQEHPPLARLLAAVPLLWLNPAVPVDDPSWSKPDDVKFGQAFFYRNRLPPDSILFAARTSSVITAALLIVVVAWWARRTFGPVAALFAALFLAFDPNVIAAARIVKNDLLLTLLSFIAVISWAEYLKGRSNAWVPAAGAAFGLAVTTKFSALFLIPVFAILALLSLRKGIHRVVALVLVLAAAVPAVAIVYAPEWRKLLPATQSYRAAHPEARRLSDVIRPDTFAARQLAAASHRLGLQDHPFWLGLATFLEHSARGHASYLNGEVGTTGWWYFFPFAFLIKTPVATLALILLALALTALRCWKSPPRWWRSLRVDWWVCVVPVLIYLAAAMVNRVNTGERHLLPIYPFLFVASAAIAARIPWRPLAVLATLLLIESASIYPHYLAFFNTAAGGPAAGPRYLLDSNLDWGQDLYHLRDYWIAQGRPKLCLLYFGTALPENHGIEFDRLPRTNETEERQSVNCLAAISATPLYGLYVPKPDLDWVRTHRPLANIGYSIYLYNLRRGGSQ